jgi:hypothetical protein
MPRKSIFVPRAARLWSVDSENAELLMLALLENGVGHELADRVLDGVADAITVPELCSLAQRRFGVLPAIVARNPRLSTADDFWACSIYPHVYEDVLDVLRASGDAVDIGMWIPAVIRTGPEVLAASVLGRFGAAATEAALDWFADSTADRMSEGWRLALIERQEQILAWFRRRSGSLSGRTLSLLADLLNPHLIDLSPVELAPWMELVKDDELLDHIRDGSAPAFILALGFRFHHQSALELVVASFERVHSAAALQTLGYRPWQFLQDLLPRLSGGWEWDKCERLRQALGLYFVQQRWVSVLHFHQKDAARHVCITGMPGC